MAISKHEKTILQQLKKEIWLHPAGGYSIQLLSKELSIDRNKLCSAFKNLFSRSIHQFVIVQRMEKAKRLLKQSDLPIKAIAIDCGYRNVKNFHTAFRKRIGKTPLMYRRAACMKSH